MDKLNGLYRYGANLYYVDDYSFERIRNDNTKVYIGKYYPRMIMIRAVDDYPVTETSCPPLLEPIMPRGDELLMISFDHNVDGRAKVQLTEAIAGEYWERREQNTPGMVPTISYECNTNSGQAHHYSTMGNWREAEEYNLMDGRRFITMP